MVTEFVYTYPDGREEVRYRRVKDSPEALKLIKEYDELRATQGESCPYSYRHVNGVQRQREVVHCVDDKWYFWDETWSFRQGPFETWQEATKALYDYAKWLESNEKRDEENVDTEESD